MKNRMIALVCYAVLLPHICIAVSTMRDYVNNAKQIETNTRHHFDPLLLTLPPIGFPAPTPAPSYNPSSVPSIIPTGEPTGEPSSVPSVIPTGQPTSIPSTSIPTFHPSSYPSFVPSTQPSSPPSCYPTGEPSGIPSGEPSGVPSVLPTGFPSGLPTTEPTGTPSVVPSGQPSTAPTGAPSGIPSGIPSGEPSGVPSVLPTGFPSGLPTTEPTGTPSVVPSGQPSTAPTGAPSGIPSGIPSGEPSGVPSVLPTGFPSGLPTTEPTGTPSVVPSGQPSTAPTGAPSGIPSGIPSGEPTMLSPFPTSIPSGDPSGAPTCQPSGLPTLTPSGEPSSLPTCVPSGEPSNQPTHEPSSGPSVAPTGEPSSLPTSFPSYEPSGQPSYSPTIAPTGFPSEMPSSAPSFRPSSQPSTVPTSQPTSPSRMPTSEPSVTPTSQPSSEPSPEPSGPPTSSPSGFPSTLPSSIPSRQPSAVPTNIPSNCPTSSPTVVPSKIPSGIPSFLPTALPSGEPSGLPSGFPTMYPSSLPSVIPSAAPSCCPSSEPSKGPSAVPSSYPTDSPVSVPTYMPSSEPTGWPTALPSFRPSSSEPTGVPSALPSLLSPPPTFTVMPSSHPSSGPSQAPLAVPTSRPTDIPTLLPSSLPSLSPSNLPTAVPTVIPSYTPTSVPSVYPSAEPTMSPTSVPTGLPHILSQNVTAGKTSLTVGILLSLDGEVYCAAYVLTEHPITTDAVVYTNRMATSINQYAYIHITELVPATEYAVYCVSLNSNRVTVTSYSDMITNRVIAKTHCCREIVVQLAATTVSSNLSMLDMVLLEWTRATDIEPLDIQLWTNYTPALASDSVTMNPFVPTMVNILPSSLATYASASLPSGLAVGDYELFFTVSGSNYSIYKLVYTPSLPVFSVVESGGEYLPDAPIVNTAEFSNDGSSVIVTFDMATDKAGLGSTFQCSKLFTFTQSSLGSCIWSSSSKVRIYASSYYPLDVGRSIIINSGVLRAECISGYTTCESYPTSTTHSVNITAPLFPVHPVVVVTAATAIGPCDDFVLDLTASTGSASRSWSNMTIYASSISDNTTDINNFFRNSFMIDPPTAVPSRAMRAGSTYRFSIILCNFLQACSAQISHTLSVQAEPLPVVSILGKKSRIIRKRDTLTLYSTVYTQSCETTSRTSEGMSFTWEIFENSMPKNLVSLSKIPAQYKLPGSLLSIGLVYEVKLTALHSSTGNYASTSVDVRVVPSDIVAVVSGGSHRSLRYGSSITLDASGSYDEDVVGLTGADAGLLFSWQCIMIDPLNITSCGVLLPSGFEKVVVTADDAEYISTTSEVTCRVYDSSSRYDEFSVVVEVLPPQSPQVFLSSTVLSTTRRKKLKLLSIVNSYVASYVSWSVEGGVIDLNAASLTPVSSTLTSGTHNFNLGLKSNVLPEYTSLSFRLTSGNSYASVTVFVAGPPISGTFHVMPSIGVELTDSFTFSTSNWVESDVNLPLTYIYTFISNVGSYMVVQGRSEKTYTSTVLSRGPSSDKNVLHCSVEAFNVLDASSSLTADVTVTPLTIEPADFDQLVEVQLSFGSQQAELSHTKQAISSSVSSMNSVNCSLAPNCTALFRRDCSYQPQTCGGCIDGYFGDNGDDNTLCYPVELSSSARDGKFYCSSDSDCGLYELCDMNASVCYRPSKACSNNCTSHGKCLFRILSSGSITDSCLSGDSECAAVCVCNEHYSGDDCSVSQSELAIRVRTRERLVAALVNMTLIEDLTVQTTEEIVTMVGEIASNRQQMSVAVCNGLLFVTEILLNSAFEIGLSYDTVNKLAPVIDNCIGFYSSLTDETLKAASLDFSFELMDLHSNVVLNDIVVGEGSVEIMGSTSRKSINELTSENPSTTVFLPQTAIERWNGRIQSSVNLTWSTNSTTTSVVVSETQAALYTNASIYATNPIKLQITDTSVLSDEVSFLISTHSGTTFSNGTVQHGNLTTICPKGMLMHEEYECTNGDKIIHECDGEERTLFTACPNVSSFPKCALIVEGVALENTACFVSNYTSNGVECTCSLTAANTQRRLDISIANEVDKTGYLEVAAISVYIADEFLTTIKSSDEITIEKLQGSVAVILMFVVLWASVLSVIAFLSVTDITHRQKVYNEKSKKQSRVSRTSRTARTTATTATPSTQDPAAVHSYLTMYIDNIIPVIFRPTVSVFKSFFGEISNHHRYLKVLTYDGLDADEVRFRVGLQLLTVQSMLMFFMALFYEIEYPRDDGTCETYDTKDNCLEETSIFDPDVSRCKWVVDGDDDLAPANCQYREVNITFRLMFIVVVFLSICAAPVNFMVDYIFDNIIAAPVADDVKVMHETPQMGRRFTNALIRGVSKLNAQLTKKSPLDYVKNSVFPKQSRKVPKDVVNSHNVAMLALNFAHGKRDANNNSSEDEFATKLKRAMSVTCNDFLDKLSEQHFALTGDARNSFDKTWGIDPSGNIPDVESRRLLCCNLSRPGMPELIDKEINHVEDIALKKIAKLKYAPDLHIGIEVIHLFLLDLLGRDTPEGRIFSYKMDQDFGHSFLVSYWAKILAWVFVAFLNIFFVYFSILRAIDRDIHWQMGYITACILQMVIEVLFFETTECLWINWQAPRLVQPDVEAAVRVLYRSLDFALANTDTNNVVLDVPQFLFVSTRVAEAFPRLFECKLILKFKTYLGGKIAEKIRQESILSHERQPLWLVLCQSFLRMISVFSVVSILRFVGTLDVAVQRVVIHVLQRVLFVLIVIFITVISYYPWLGFVPALLLLYQIKSCLHHRRVQATDDDDFFSPIPIADTPFAKCPSPSVGVDNSSPNHGSVQLTDPADSAILPGRSERSPYATSNNKSNSIMSALGGDSILLGDEDDEAEKVDDSDPKLNKSVDPFIWSLFNMDTSPGTGDSDGNIESNAGVASNLTSTSITEKTIPPQKSIGKLFDPPNESELSHAPPTYRGAFVRAVDPCDSLNSSENEQTPVSKVRRFSFKSTESTELQVKNERDESSNKKWFGLPRMLSFPEDSESENDKNGSRSVKRDEPSDSIIADDKKDLSVHSATDVRKGEEALGDSSSPSVETDERSRRRMSRLRRLFSWGSVDGDEEVEVSIRTPQQSNSRCHTRPPTKGGFKARGRDESVTGIEANPKSDKATEAGVCISCERDTSSADI